MAIFTGIALNLISNSIHDKRKQLSKLEKRIEQKIEKLKILNTNNGKHRENVNGPRPSLPEVICSGTRYL
jgi:hypothetical protein